MFYANIEAFNYFYSLMIASNGGITDDYLSFIFKLIIPKFYSGMSKFMFSDLANKKLGLLPIFKVTAGEVKNC